jgi:hypothetical protein
MGYSNTKKQRIESMKTLSVKEILDYEVRSHWLASRIGFSWGQDLIARHLANKVRRKHRRYLHSLETQEYIKGLKP